MAFKNRGPQKAILHPTPVVSNLLQHWIPVAGGPPRPPPGGSIHPPLGHPLRNSLRGYKESFLDLRLLSKAATQYSQCRSRCARSDLAYFPCLTGALLVGLGGS